MTWAAVSKREGASPMLAAKGGYRDKRAKE